MTPPLLKKPLCVSCVCVCITLRFIHSADSFIERGQRIVHGESTAGNHGLEVRSILVVKARYTHSHHAPLLLHYPTVVKRPPRSTTELSVPTGPSNVVSMCSSSSSTLTDYSLLGLRALEAVLGSTLPVIPANVFWLYNCPARQIGRASCRERV